MDRDFTDEKKTKFSIKDNGGKLLNGIKRGFGAITVPGLLKVTLLLVILHLVIFLFRPLPVLVTNAPLKARRISDRRTQTIKAPARRTRTTAARRRKATTARKAPARQKPPQTLKSGKPYRRPAQPTSPVGVKTETVQSAEK